MYDLTALEALAIDLSNATAGSPDLDSRLSQIIGLPTSAPLTSDLPTVVELLKDMRIGTALRISFLLDLPKEISCRAMLNTEHGVIFAYSNDWPIAVCLVLVTALLAIDDETLRMH
jgi:hypothetical protein